MKVAATIAAILTGLGLIFIGARYALHYHSPRTSFGDPDLQGVWTNSSRTTLERSPLFDRLEIPPESAEFYRKKYMEKKAREDFFDLRIRPRMLKGPQAMKAFLDRPDMPQGMLGYDTEWWDFSVGLAKMNGKFRTSWVVDPPDGRVPYTDRAWRTIKGLFRNQRGHDDPEQLRQGERCLVGFGSSAGPPMLNVEYNNTYQIVQSPGFVAISIEMVHDVRLIRLGGRHLPDTMRPWLGDTIGHWEGDTLVAETTNINPEQSFVFENNHFLYLAPDAKVVERFTRTSKKQILYQFEVSSPWAYSQTWKGEIPMRATKGPVYEYACHEGNKALYNILGAARKDDAKTNIDQN